MTESAAHSLGNQSGEFSWPAGGDRLYDARKCSKGQQQVFLEAIYFAPNQITKVMHAFGSIAVCDI